MGGSMRSTVVLAAVLLLVQNSAGAKFDLPSPWTYDCVSGDVGSSRCEKREITGQEEVVSFNLCKLTCGAHGSLWPMPSGSVTLGNAVDLFTVAKVTQLITAPSAVSSLLDENMNLFRQHLDMYHPDYDAIGGTAPWGDPTDPNIEAHVLQVEVQVTSEEDRLSLSTNESYNLNLVPAPGVTTVIIIAETFFGARHGIETLSQLINYNEDNDCLQIINSVVIVNDAPRFPYRGIIVDTSRNFLKIVDVKRTIDAMSSNKLNTFHWHITDSHSVPIDLETLPMMTQYGIYSTRHMYSQDEILAVVEYGRVRGVRVLPEIDAPAHVGNGWQWGPQEGLGNLAVCINKEPWQQYCVEPPCGQMNIANENLYNVLRMLYREFVSMFQPLDLFHFGGDEVNLNCWNSTQEIIDWMATVGDGSLTEDAYYLQWSEFQNRAYDLFNEENGVNVTGIIWTSHLTEQGRADQYLDKDKYIIQIWTTGNDPVIAELLQKGFRVIFSNYDALYLDCGFGAWVGEGNNWCSPYKGWQLAYDNDPLSMAGSADYYDQVIGAEAALWSEQADEQNVDSKLWPRGAAMAERLWSNPSTSWREAEYRIVHHRQRMVQRGVAAERLQPEWCHQNAGYCYL